MVTVFLTSMLGLPRSRARCDCTGHPTVISRHYMALTLPGSALNTLHVTQGSTFIISIHLTLSYTASRWQSQDLNPSDLAPVNPCSCPLCHRGSRTFLPCMGGIIQGCVFCSIDLLALILVSCF